jgi:hypothetical protein
MSGYALGLDHDLLRFVLVKTGKPLFYGWKTYDFSGTTGVSSGDLVFMAHKTLAQMQAISGAIAVIGANSPKPARYKFVLNKKPGPGQQGSISTFGAADIESVTGFADSGWERIEDRKRVNITDNTRSQTLGAKCENGGYYLYTCSKTMPSQVLTELGLISAADLKTGSEIDKAFYSSSRPRPPKMQKILAGGYNATTFCSFDMVDDAIDLGWKIVDSGKTFYVGAA